MAYILKINMLNHTSGPNFDTPPRRRFHDAASEQPAIGRAQPLTSLGHTGRLLQARLESPNPREKAAAQRDAALLFELMEMAPDRPAPRNGNGYEYGQNKAIVDAVRGGKTSPRPPEPASFPNSPTAYIRGQDMPPPPYK